MTEEIPPTDLLPLLFTTALVVYVLASGSADLTMTTLFREVDVEVFLPSDYWPPATALADLSKVVAAHSKARKRCL